jgi:hypothetical protein
LWERGRIDVIVQRPLPLTPSHQWRGEYVLGRGSSPTPTSPAPKRKKGGKFEDHKRYSKRLAFMAVLSYNFCIQYVVFFLGNVKSFTKKEGKI